MALSDNSRGTMFMCAAMALFTMSDAVMKVLLTTMPLFQAIALRGMVTVVAMVALAAATGNLSFRLSPHDLRVMSLRSLAEVLGTVFFLMALMHLPLPTLTAMLQALPLAVTLGAALIYHEPVGRVRLTAIAIGFVGVLIIVRPGAEGFNGWSMLGLAAVVACMVRDLATRGLSREVPSIMVAIWASIMVTVMGAIGCLFEGVKPITVTEWPLMLTTGGLVAVGYTYGVMAMRVGDIALVAPFRYVSLIWAVLLGWLVFNTLPDAMTLLGATLVVITGIFTLLRERRLRLRLA